MVTKTNWKIGQMSKNQLKLFNDVKNGSLEQINQKYFYLTPKYNNQKSFYGKCDVKIEKNYNYCKIYMGSYDTLICFIEFNFQLNSMHYIIHNNNLISQTTNKHLIEFLKQWFFNENVKLSKKIILQNENTILFENKIEK